MLPPEVAAAQSLFTPIGAEEEVSPEEGSQSQTGLETVTQPNTALGSTPAGA